MSIAPSAAQPESNPIKELMTALKNRNNSAQNAKAPIPQNTPLTKQTMMPRSSGAKEIERSALKSTAKKRKNQN